MSILVEKVRIKNFRSLKDISIHLSPITLLIGANNSGKTTFLRALSLAFNGERKYWSKNDLFIGRDGQSLPKEEQIIRIDIKIIPSTGQEFEDNWTQLAFGEDIRTDANNQDFFAFRTEINFSETEKEAQIKRYRISDWDSGSAEEEITANLSGLPFYFMDAQRDLQEDLRLQTSSFGKLANEIEYDEEKQKEIEEMLKMLNQEAVENSEVLKHLKSALEELNKTVSITGRGVEITPFTKKIRDLSKGINVHFQDNGSDSFNLEYQGMGTRSWASLLALKAKISWDAQKAISRNDVFFPMMALEEPEAHLHPNAQRQVYRQLTDIKGQKFISTHSPYIAGIAQLEELRHFSKREDFTIINHVHFTYDEKVLELEDKLLNASVDRQKKDLTQELKAQKDKKREVIRRIKNEIIKTRGEILFSRVIILFEGITEEQALPIFAYEYFGAFPYELGLSFVNVGGKGNYLAYINLLNCLNIKWFILSDSEEDTIEDVKQQVEEAKGDFGQVVLLPIEDDFEAYILKEYENEVRKAIAIYYTEHSNIYQFNQEKLKEWLEKPLEDIKDFMNGKEKAKISSIYANLIVQNNTINKRIPNVILELLDKVKKELNCKAKFSFFQSLFSLLNSLKLKRDETTTI